MKRKASPRSRPAEPRRAVVPEPIIEDDGSERIVARPDGYHWLALDGHNEFGPFTTAEEARADMLAAEDDGASAPGENLQEAEDEIGIADWIDPDTGEPAEGLSPPHLERE